MNALTAYDSQLARLMMISFFLPLRVQVFIIIPLCAFWAIRDVLLTRDRSRIARFYIPLLLAGTYLLYLIYIPLTAKSDLPYLFSQVEYRASMLLMPFAFFLLTEETRQVIRKEFRWFVIACGASCFLGNIVYLAQSGWTISAGSHVDYRLTFEGVTGVHPTYMGMYIVFSLSWLLLEPGWRTRIRSWVVTVVFLAGLLFLFALLPKTPVIALALILTHYCFSHRTNKQLVLQLLLGVVAALLVAWFFIPFSAQRLGELTANAGTSSVVQNSVSMRKLIWTVDLQLLKDHWLLGAGPGQMPVILARQYYFYSLVLGYPLGVYDTHNEYLNQWVSFGILGLVVLLIIFLAHFKEAISRKDHLYLYLMVIIALTCLTENVLATQHGVVFYAFFSSLFFFSGHTKSH